MYECFNCLKRCVIWDCDYDFEDYGLEGEGIVHVCLCGACGAEIEYRVPCDLVSDVNVEDESCEQMSIYDLPETQ